MRIYEQIFEYIQLSKNIRMNIRIYSYWGNGTNTNMNNIWGPFYSNIGIFVLITGIQCKKTSALCKLLFLEKFRNTAENYRLFKNFICCQFFLIFSEMVLCRELGFFAVHSLHQNASYELSKSTIWHLVRFVTNTFVIN